MGFRLYQEPQLENPIVVASWPGTGNIGIIAIDTLRETLGAEELGEIEPWDFFCPKRVSIRKGILEHLEFPSSKFYFKRMQRRRGLWKMLKGSSRSEVREVEPHSSKGSLTGC